MRVLVTGARGFVGSVLVPAFRAGGHEVVARGSPGSEDGLDVRDAAEVRGAVLAARPDAVVHLAGVTHLPNVLADPAAAFAVNVAGTRNVLEAARQEAKGARVLVASSAAVYGSPGPGGLPLEEGSPLLSEHPYGVQKIAVECLAERYREDHGLPVTIVRPFNHLGPGQEPRFAASWFAVQIARAEEGLAPPVLRVGNLEPKRDLLDVRDVVRAYGLLIARTPFDGLFNVASGKSVRIGWILDWLLGRCRTKVTVESDESLFRPWDAPDLRGSSERLTAATGWTPQIPLEETLAAVLEDARGRASSEKQGSRSP